MFYKGHQMIVSLKKNQRMGILEDWLSEGKLLKDLLKELDTRLRRVKKLGYVI